MSQQELDLLDPQLRVASARTKRRNRGWGIVLAGLVLIIGLASITLTAIGYLPMKSLVIFVASVVVIFIPFLISFVRAELKFEQQDQMVITGLQRYLNADVGWQSLNPRKVSDLSSKMPSIARRRLGTRPGPVVFAATGSIAGFSASFVYRSWLAGKRERLTFELHLTLRTTVPGSLWLSSKYLPFGESQEIHLESNEFNAEAIVQATPSKIAQQILSPTVMTWYQDDSQHAGVCIEGSSLVLLQEVFDDVQQKFEHLPQLFKDAEYLARMVNDLYTNEP